MADIHGSRKALTKALRLLESLRIDTLLAAGDIVFDAAGSIAEMLEQAPFTVLAVRGNCDSGGSGLIELPEFRLFPFAGRQIFMTHGHRSTAGEALGLFPGDICITGHTHTPVLQRTRSGIISLNPGSAAHPRGGSTPSLGIIEADSVSIYSIRSKKVMKSLFLEQTEAAFQNRKKL